MNGYPPIPGSLEIRQEGLNTILAGFFPYNVQATISNRGKIRKEVIAPGAFDFAIDEGREINLLVGHDFGKPLATTRNGSLALSTIARPLLQPRPPALPARPPALPARPPALPARPPALPARPPARLPAPPARPPALPARPPARPPAPPARPPAPPARPPAPPARPPAQPPDLPDLPDLSQALRFEAVLPTQMPVYMSDAVDMILAGLVGGISPGFTVAGVPDATEIIPEPDNPGVEIRVIRQALLYELSIVTRPAYPETELTARERAEEPEPGRIALRRWFV